MMTWLWEFDLQEIFGSMCSVDKRERGDDGDTIIVRHPMKTEDQAYAGSSAVGAKPSVPFKDAESPRVLSHTNILYSKPDIDLSINQRPSPTLSPEMAPKALPMPQSNVSSADTVPAHSPFIPPLSGGSGSTVPQMSPINHYVQNGQDSIDSNDIFGRSISEPEVPALESLPLSTDKPKSPMDRLMEVDTDALRRLASIEERRKDDRDKFTEHRGDDDQDGLSPHRSNLVALSRSKMLHQVPDPGIISIRRLMKVKQVSAGSFVCQNGDIGDKVVLVCSGQLEVFAGEQATVLESGDFFGEAQFCTVVHWGWQKRRSGVPAALPSAAFRNTDCRALSDCELLELDAKPLIETNSINHKVFENIEKIARGGIEANATILAGGRVLLKETEVVDMEHEHLDV